jgi:hypothetical protein
VAVRLPATAGGFVARSAPAARAWSSGLSARAPSAAPEPADGGFAAGVSRSALGLPGLSSAVARESAMASDASGSAESAPAGPAPFAPLTPAASPVAVASASAGTGAGAGAAGPAGGVPAAELPELAERIYEHLARRLRAELLADRERRGLLADPL